MNKVNKTLNLLSKAAHEDTNLISPIIKCIKNNCSLGEICDIMKSVYGEYI